jgi:hypothetical protein
MPIDSDLGLVTGGAMTDVTAGGSGKAETESVPDA